MSAPVNNGGPAFPVDHEFVRPDANEEQLRAACGMTLRDYLARNTPHDEVCEMTYKHLSLLAQERLAGMKRPESDSNLRGEAVVDQQIALMTFYAKVNAALRYISADAMLAARKVSHEA